MSSEDGEQPDTGRPHEMDDGAPGVIDAPPGTADTGVDDEIRPVPVIAIAAEPESSETAPKRGRWEVITEASRYELDLDRELLRRIRGTAQPANPDVGFPAKLRDHERGWVRLLRILQLEIGRPAIFDIESLGGPEVLFTRRTTTFVLSVRQVKEKEWLD